MKFTLFTLILLFSQVLLAQNQGPPPAPIEKKVIFEEDENDIIEFPDVEAEFKGGMEGLQKYISQNINYPIKAIEDHLEGKVYVAFVIDKRGKVSAIVVERGAHAVLDAEAKRVIKNMPKWKPGKKNGRKVNTRVRLPINFTLN